MKENINLMLWNICSQNRHILSIMNLLAIDTSTEQLCLALIAQDKVFTHEELGGAAASAALFPAIEALLQKAQIKIHQIEYMAFGKGPGAFTGLRTACSVTQGIAAGLGCGVFPLDSLMVVAQDALNQYSNPYITVAVVMDARMGELYAGIYRHQDGLWNCLQEPALWQPEPLQNNYLAQSNAAMVWAGTGLHLLNPHVLAPFKCYEQAASRAQALAQCAKYAYHHQQPVDAAQALPLYLRDKVALTTAERQSANSQPC
jgi:tRNA threonylcarbamoyladenosine biosynthesis protein TsaB